MKQLGLITFFSCLLFSCGPHTQRTVVLNEICGKEFPNNEWVEVFNASDTTVNMNGYTLIKIDEDGIDYIIYTFKDVRLAPGEAYVVSSMKNELRRNLSRKKELGIELVAPDGKTVDDFYRDEEVGEHPHPANGSYARLPNATGSWAIVKNASRGEANPKNAEVIDNLADELGAAEEPAPEE